MKSLIKKSFDRASSTYETSADIQKIVAKDLTKTIKNKFYENTLEIGIGSGLFTEILLQKIEFSNYIAIDLSIKSLEKAKEKLKDVKFVNADVEILPIKTCKFDLIVSSSSLQWLENPCASIRNLLKNTRKGCEVHFSIFVKGTFKEMDYIHSLTKFGCVFKLKSENFYKNLLNSMDNFEWKFKRKNYILNYNSINMFLKQHKNTGATFTNRKTFIGKQSYLNFCNLYQRIFALSSGKVPVTYSVLFINGIKN